MNMCLNSKNLTLRSSKIFVLILVSMVKGVCVMFNLLGKIASYLLPEEEKQKIIEQEISFLKNSLAVREQILNRLMVAVKSCDNVKDLAKAVETISKEIKRSYKVIGKMLSDSNSKSSVEEDSILEDISDLEKKLTKANDFVC